MAISAFSPNNSKEKITSPTSQHDNLSSLSSNKKKKRDINKIGLITNQKNTVYNNFTISEKICRKS